MPRRKNSSRVVHRSVPGGKGEIVRFVIFPISVALPQDVQGIAWGAAAAAARRANKRTTVRIVDIG